MRERRTSSFHYQIDCVGVVGLSVHLSPSHSSETSHTNVKERDGDISRSIDSIDDSPYQVFLEGLNGWQLVLKWCAELCKILTFYKNFVLNSNEQLSRASVRYNRCILTSSLCSSNYTVLSIWKSKQRTERPLNNFFILL